MGVDWKIYEPVKTIGIKEFLEICKRILIKYPKSRITSNSSKCDIEEFRNVSLLENFKFKEYNGTIKMTSQNEFKDLYLSEGILDFAIFRSSTGSNDNTLGFEIITGKKQEKPNLEILLPYKNKKQSIEELSETLSELNEDLCLNFRDKEQINYTVNKLINNIFDDKFYDSHWTLKHSHHFYSSSGATKKIFEDNTQETFRSTGIRIIFPEIIGNLVGWKESHLKLINSVLKRFGKSQLEVYFNTSFKDFSKVLTNSSLNEIKINTTFDITDHINEIKIETLEFLFSEDKSGFRIENTKQESEDDKSFSFDLYRIKNDDFEIRLEIDINANEEEIESLIKVMGIELKYTHSE